MLVELFVLQVDQDDLTGGRMPAVPGVSASGQHHLATPIGGALTDNSGSDNTPLHSPRSPLNTSRDDDDSSSNQPSSDCRSPSSRQAIDM